ncbi:MAG: hypothetical protein GY749_10955, partial [Desulfobacteraceae bacterium]|nr:hypothetical protein [Desulfobacteraceae bacterium]
MIAFLMFFPSHGWARRWDFAISTEGWTGHNATVHQGDDFLYADPSGYDPGVVSPSSLNLSASSYGIVKFRLGTNCPDNNGRIYFTTSSSSSFSEGKSVPFTVTRLNDWDTYQIDMTNNGYWSGTITRIRVDPANNGDPDGGYDLCAFDWIEIVSKSVLTAPTLLHPINGESVSRGADGKVTLEWNQVSGNAGYQLQIDTLQPINMSANQTRYDAFLGDGSHQWRIRTENSIGVYGDWSAYEYFTCQTDSPICGTMELRAFSGSDIYTPPYADFQYRYGPSIILDGDIVDMWASAPGFGTPMDIIKHRRGKINEDGTIQWMTNWVTAITATPNSLDQCSTCDPSVIYPYNDTYIVAKLQDFVKLSDFAVFVYNNLICMALKNYKEAILYVTG